jgi:pyruvate formate lyase activating enzyme
MVKENQCTHCNRCYNPCGHEICKKYGRCLFACPLGLISLTGKEMDSADVAAKVLRGKDFMRMSGGGVTISGGEPLMQHEFTLDLLKRTSELHRAIQTSGFASNEIFSRVIENTDYVMMDLKLADPALHKEYTGVDNTVILENAEILKKSGKVHVFRVPLIPDITDTEENLRKISEIAGDSPVELLPYNVMAGAKYKSVGLTYPLEGHKKENNKIDITIFKKGKLL